MPALSHSINELSKYVILTMSPIELRRFIDVIQGRLPIRYLRLSLSSSGSSGMFPPGGLPS